jgi:hypothetical protein
MRNDSRSRSIVWWTALLVLGLVVGCGPDAVPERGILSGHEGLVTSVAFAPDGGTLVSRGADDTVKVWSVTRRRVLSDVPGFPSTAGEAVFSPDGSRVAANEASHGVTAWDAASGDDQVVYRYPDRESPQWGCYSVSYGWGVAYSSDGGTLAAGGSNLGADGFVTIWDVATGEATNLTGHRSPVTSVAFSPLGDLLASGSLDGSVRIWDVAAREERMKLEGHEGGVLAVRVSPDGGTLASASLDHTVRLWDMTTGAASGVFSEHREGVCSVAFSRDGRLAASGDARGTILLWNVADGRVVGRTWGHRGRVWSVAFSPVDDLFATGGEDGAIRLWGLPKR